MEKKYCWRCNANAKMLTDEEFELCQRALHNGKKIVDEELKRRKIETFVWRENIETFEKFRYMLEMYRVITGEYESNPMAIFHHQISQYGKDCPGCGKPFRTPQARYCPSCGYGKENLIGQ